MKPDQLPPDPFGDREMFYGMDGKPIPVDEYPGSVTVEYTDLGSRGRVSTILLGIDMNFSGYGPPLIFETMVFGGPYDLKGIRYATVHDALLGHRDMVNAVRALPKPRQLLHNGRKP